MLRSAEVFNDASCLELGTPFYSVFIDIMDTFTMFNALLRGAIAFITAYCYKMCSGLLKDDDAAGDASLPRVPSLLLKVSQNICSTAAVYIKLSL